ncbi:MAG TPA: uroporphyrinogen decarboxylase, partial [Bacteroidetes bacterium]|nr:uroporphyrinogen decarboxylase [Bacteroidota bacterium]
TFSVARRLLVQNPRFAHALLGQITEATIAYLKGQIAAGADIVQIFDSWAGVLSRKLFLEFALPYLHRIAATITEVPVIVFAKGANFALDQLAKLPCEVLGLDWTLEPETAIAQAPKMAFQGNMDPAMMYAPQDVLRAETLAMLDRFPSGRHIANLGHGIYPDMPRENVQLFVDTIKEFRYS